MIVLIIGNRSKYLRNGKSKYFQRFSQVLIFSDDNIYENYTFSDLRVISEKNL